MKISIIYHSVSGNTRGIAELVAAGARLGGDVEVRIMSIEEVDETYVNESAAVILGCPTHRGNLSWHMKQWMETTRLKFGGKMGSVFVTANYIGGGADFAEMEMIAHLLTMGALVYSGGTAWGQPYTHFGSVVIKEGDEAQRERARLFGERVAKKALELFGA